jgi:hypothetical protein
MQIIFSNVFGCHSKSEFILNNAELINVSEEEYDIALSQGWLITAKQNKPHWYQSRSTRTRLSLTNYSFNNEFSVIDHTALANELDVVYTLYCKHKHYNKYFEVDEFLDIDQVIGYYDSTKLTAWTKLRQYSENSIESVLFAWDYTKPETHLGLTSLRCELAWAKQQGYEYFYMGPGYEKNSIYKSDIDGFEWWTGREWSQDTEEYTWLCKRDSKVASYHQIHSVLANLQPYRNNR